MAANDNSDPEVKALMQRVEEYRRLYDFKRRPFDRESVAHLYKKDEDFTAFDIAPPVGGFSGMVPVLDRLVPGYEEVRRK